MCTNILEEISSESFIWHCYYRVSYFFFLEEIYSEICSKYLARKFVWNFYLIFLPLCIIFGCLGRNLFWNVYQIFTKYLGRKSFWKFYLILLTFYIWEEVYSEMGTKNFGRNFFWKCFLTLLTLNILLQIWEEIHYEICFNILEENSSENITWNCYLWVSSFLYLGVKFFCKLYLI